MQAAVGGVLLEEEGGAAAEYSDQVARGQQAFDDWIAENGVDFDPGLGVRLVEGNVESVDTSVSFAVGDNAAPAPPRSPTRRTPAPCPAPTPAADPPTKWQEVPREVAEIQVRLEVARTPAARASSSSSR